MYSDFWHGTGRAGGDDGVHRPVARDVGGWCPGAGEGFGEHDLRSGRAGVDRVFGAGTQKAPSPVKTLVVETEFVFDRHAATDLSVAYAILVPQRRAPTMRAGPGRRGAHEQRGEGVPGGL